MSEAFLKVVNMSISAGWLVLAVLALRLILKKAPKWVNVLLWGIVAVRLICPFSIESALSLIPSRETISPEIMMDWTPEISTGIAPLDQVVNPVISTSFAPNPGTSANPLQILIPVAANLWLLGVLILLAYTAISYLCLCRKLRTAVILRGNIFQCETVSSPFVLGIVKPRIYLSYAMDDQNLRHVVAHEQAHIRRKDHWWKPLGFMLLTVYWFNPLMWVAYILLCRDIELACDEKVIAELGNEQRADYTQALVACAVNRRMIAACPLAFGEIGVKDRIKSIMNYRKPTFWIIVAALVVCAVVAVCFLTDPNPSPEFPMKGNNVRNLDVETIIDRIIRIEDVTNSNVYMNSNNYSLTVNSNFEWVDSQSILYFFSRHNETYGAQLQILPDEEKYHLSEADLWSDQVSIFLLRHYLDALKYMPQNVIRQMAPADRYIIQHAENGRPSDYERVITYSSDGVQETDGWFIHLQLHPLHADAEEYTGTGEDVIHLFYGGSEGKYSAYAKMWFDYTAAPERMQWTEEMKCTIEEFPGITFKYTPYEIVATTSWEDSDTAGRTILISGMPIWNAYFCDLTGDGLPEICSQLSFGSGIIDNRVVIFDYAKGVSYKLEDRGYYDYYLRMNDADGCLYVDKRVYNSDEMVSTGKLVFRDGCIQIEGAESESREVFQARIIEIHDNYFLVEPIEGSWELSSADRIEVPMKNMSPSPEPKVGDILNIEYDGQIMETYPARIGQVYGISVVREEFELPAVDMVVHYSQQRLNDTFIGISRETLHDLWGSPDSLMQNYNGEIYHVPGKYQTVMLYFNSDDTVKAVEIAERNIYLPGSTYEICNTAPLEDLPDTYNLEEATIDRCVIIVDGDVRDNADVWEAFISRVNAGENASVRIIRYYHGSETEPSSMYISELTYDGSTYQLRWFEEGKEQIRTYRYLRYFSGEAETESAEYNAYAAYILTDDLKATRWEMFLSYASSAIGAAIPHHEVYTDLIYYPDYPEIPASLEKAELIKENEQIAVYDDQAVLDRLRKLLASAEGLGYEPKTYGICCDLVLTGTDGSVLTLELDALSDYFVLDGVFFDYGPGYDEDGCLDATGDMLAILGLTQWP